MIEQVGAQNGDTVELSAVRHSACGALSIKSDAPQTADSSEGSSSFSFLVPMLSKGAVVARCLLSSTKNASTASSRDDALNLEVAAGTDSAPAKEAARLNVLLISSSGGHWKQLLRLRPAFNRENLLFACTQSSYSSLVGGQPFFAVPEGSLSSKLALLLQALAVFILLLRTRPDVVVTTGAAPGFFALLFANRVIGPMLQLFRGRSIKTVWVDSIANVDELSTSGRQAAPFADMHLTQWPHLADCISPGKPAFCGAVL